MRNQRARAQRTVPPSQAPAPRRAAALLLALGLGGCAAPPEAGVVPVESGVPEHPFLRYVDGQVSANATCAILTGNRLNPRIPPVRINGQPIGFC